MGALAEGGWADDIIYEVGVAWFWANAWLPWFISCWMVVIIGTENREVVFVWLEELSLALWAELLLSTVRCPEKC